MQVKLTGNAKANIKGLKVINKKIHKQTISAALNKTANRIATETKGGISAELSRETST